jgi:cytochrome P450
MAITDGFELVDAQSYAERGYPHSLWTRLRSESPVHACHPPGFRRFWAITKHADVCEISRQPELFLNGPRITLVPLEFEATQGSGTFQGMRTVINTDPPEHRDLRRVASAWFTPNSLRRIDAEIRASARRAVDRIAAKSGCDFVAEVAALHPLSIIARILGVPERDEPLIQRLTNQLFGAQDPEFQRSADHHRGIAELGAEMFRYFGAVITSRRAEPRDDLASVLANARLGDQPLGEMETFGYYLIVFTAGHETTRNALSGGMLALLEHPEELEKLRRDPGLIPLAIEEILRWTTPVNYMARTVARDTRFRGHAFAKEDTLVLFYASANRDEDVFPDPFRFRADRRPNPHLAFGIGEHFCMGANLARRSSAALFAELLPRLEHVELAGPPERVASAFVAGLKHLPLRYRIRAA